MTDTPHKRILSLRYSGERTKVNYLKFFAALASRYGLNHCRKGSRTLIGRSRDEVTRLSMSCWSLPDIEKLQQANLLPWPEEKVQAFTRPVDIHSFTYTGKEGAVKITIEAANDNIYPVLGAWTWLSDDLHFKGGFVTIQSHDRAMLRQLADEILRFTYPNLEKELNAEPSWKILAQELGLGRFDPQAYESSITRKRGEDLTR